MDIVPDLIDVTANGESLHSNVVLHHKLAGDARIVFASELIRDTGKRLRPASRSAIITGKRGEDTSGGRLTVSALPDGYYQLRVTAAATSGADEEKAMSILYLRSTAGRLDIIDVNEYYAMSQANTGVVVGGAP